MKGLRNILWINQYAMYRDNHPEHTHFSKVSPKFMIATLGPTKGTAWL